MLRIFSNPFASISGVENVLAARHHLLHRRAAHELVRELVDAGLPAQRDADSMNAGQNFASSSLCAIL